MPLIALGYFKYKRHCLCHHHLPSGRKILKQYNKLERKAPCSSRGAFFVRLFEELAPVVVLYAFAFLVAGGKGRTVVDFRGAGRAAALFLS